MIWKGIDWDVKNRIKFKIHGRSEVIKTNTVCRTYCCHDIYMSDYLRMEFFLYKKKLNWTLREMRENGKQIWSKQRNSIIANISSVSECHKIDTSSWVRKTVANAANDQEKDEQRFTKSGTTKRVRASKWGTAGASPSKRGKCLSTQMQSQKISPINCTGHST